MNHSFLWLLPINIKSSSLPGSASVWLSWKIHPCIGSVPACLPIQYTGLFLIGTTYLIADRFFSHFFLHSFLLLELMVVCYQNCSELLWEKNFLVIEKFAKILRSLEQFIQTVKGQKKFWWQNAFLTCSWRFLISNKLEKIIIQIGKKYLDLETCRKS